MRPALHPMPSYSVPAPVLRPVAPPRGRVVRGWAYRANVALRVLAGTLGAYAVAALLGMALARTLPLARVDATVAGTLLGLLAMPGATIWAFLAPGPWRALGGVGGAALVCALIAWVAGIPA
jgi:hypothetical protein